MLSLDGTSDSVFGILDCIRHLSDFFPSIDKRDIGGNETLSWIQFTSITKY